MNRDHPVVFEIASKYCISDSLADHDGYSISSEGFLPTVVGIMPSELNSLIPVSFNLLIPKMSTFTLAISCLTTFQFALIHGSNNPGSYAILLFTALDLASITSHIHSWVLFFLWLHPFILSGVVSPLISSSILGSSFFSVLFLPLYPTLLMGFSRQEYWSGLPFPFLCSSL